MANDSLGLTIFLLRKDQVAGFDQRFPPTAANALPLAPGNEGRFIPLPSTQQTRPHNRPLAGSVRSNHCSPQRPLYRCSPKARLGC